jgi:outer membrane murein-binding lipoprotein Lpp
MSTSGRYLSGAWHAQFMKLVLAGVAVATLVLSGCSGSSTPVDASCDSDTLRSTFEMILHDSEITLASVDSVECSGSWAVVKATLTGEGLSGVSEPSIFERVGADWVLKAPENVCGTFTPGDGRPNDSAVPEAIWEAGCVIA